ncbi:MAG TPA: DUF3105 domain-containing protein [Mycobacteriales bacterium]|nr:DUF3105 domain-containing protein [Mycobacteriales bacterium]
MSKRNDPVARARGRKAAPVKKPFPTGFVLGSAALAAALIAILVYAVQNEGIGDHSSLKYAESQVDGIKSTFQHYKRNHVNGPVSYPNQRDTPPVGGDHNPIPQSCQAYTSPIANEHAVHSLEHGAVWITYNPDKVTPADIAVLKADLEESPFRMLSPYPGLKKPISLQAWGEQVFVDKASDKRIKTFLKYFTSGPQDLERGSACQGTTTTGPVQPAPQQPSTAPTSGASSTPTTAATPSTSPSSK